MSALVGEWIRRNAFAGCGSLMLTSYGRIQAVDAKSMRLLRHNVKDSRRHAISGLPLGCALPHAVYYSLELNRREGAAMGIQSQQRLGSVLHQC